MDELLNIHLEMSPKFREKFVEWFNENIANDESTLSCFLKHKCFHVIEPTDHRFMMNNNVTSRIMEYQKPDKWIATIINISLSDFDPVCDQCVIKPTHTHIANEIFSSDVSDHFVLKPHVLVGENGKIVNLIGFILEEKGRITPEDFKRKFDTLREKMCDRNIKDFLGYIDYMGISKAYPECRPMFSGELKDGKVVMFNEQKTT